MPLLITTLFVALAEIPSGFWPVLMSIGITPTTILFFIMCELGGFARVVATHGWRSLWSTKAVADAAIGSASALILPYFVPAFVLDRMPAVAIGFVLMAITYATNDLVINMVVRRFLPAPDATATPGGKP